MELADECLSGTDCVVIATDHSHYDYQHIADKAGLIFDTRGATKKLKNNNIVRL
jgi:UDP-N-acetyl-D-glucosamine dehydrogenase